ncbi:hypothetical protein FACS1894127_5010 [Clostridia bacterium]|nr:hypothetical protein FACS1894127_5010 [Clostridia bacterium]
MKNTTNKILAATLALVLTIGLSACANGSSPANVAGGDESNPSSVASGEKRTLAVATWGGASETGLRTIVGPFEAANNCEVVFDIGNNADRYSKLLANRNSPIVDVALFSDTFSDLGNAEGLFEKVTREEVPNIANLYSFGPNKDGFGPGYSVVRYGIMYNHDKISNPPVSYKELFTRDDLKFVLLQTFAQLAPISIFLKILLAHSIVILPYIVRNTVSVLVRFDWTLEEAAASLGANGVQILTRVTFPLIRPGVMAGGLLAFLFSFDDVTLASFLTGPKFITLPVRVMTYMEFAFDPTLAAISTVLIMISLTAIFILERYVGLDIMLSTSKTNGN